MIHTTTFLSLHANTVYSNSSMRTSLQTVSFIGIKRSDHWVFIWKIIIGSLLST